MQDRTPDRGRITSIDMLRGFVIVLMILDHVRDFFGPHRFSPTDLARTSVPLFLTRWVTHLCAPIFVLLAGLGTALYEARGRTKAQVSRLLWTRGLWLIFLELAVVNLSWTAQWNGFMFVQVIWVLGLSMILMAGIIHLPRWAIWTFALTMILGHNLLDGIPAAPNDAVGFLWALLHQTYFLPFGPSFGLAVVYPLLPWPGVMALGYLMGPVFEMEAVDRRRWLLRLGGGATLAFVLLRLLNGYGDPSPWQYQERGLGFTILSFLNTTKYPASLSFLLMTLGPGTLLLVAFEHWRGRLAWAMEIFGKVPLFLYVVHIPVAHIMGAVYSKIAYGSVLGVYAASSNWPEAYVPSLLRVHVAWIVVTALIFPACLWFARVKKTRRDWWLRYL